jgi:CubicO group peptidase (beta-lactamase class C family)
MFLLCLLSGSLSWAGNPPWAGSVDEELTRRAADGTFSGAVSIAKDGVLLYTAARGDAVNGDSPNAADTKFRFGSMGKMFTAVAIAQLAQAGKLATADVVGKHLPDYPNERVRREVTIRHLIDMRSGLGDFDNDNYHTYLARRLTLRTLDDYIALFAQDSLRFAPGTETYYSNASYVVLGKIVERVSGQPYYDYIREKVFQPAGMVHTGYFTLDDHAPYLAVPYTTSAAATGDMSEGAKPLAERRPATSLLAYRGSSAGGGYSSADDLLRFTRALWEHRLLNAAFTDSLFRFRDTGPGRFDWSGWAGGAEGVNTVLYTHSTGHTLIVLSNYDPPSAMVYRRKLWDDWLPAWLKDR